MRDYPESVAFLGQWGRFQQVVFFLLCATIVPNGFGAFNLVFLTDVPRHHCALPDVNLTEDWRDSIIPVQVSRGGARGVEMTRRRLQKVHAHCSQTLQYRVVHRYVCIGDDMNNTGNT